MKFSVTKCWATGKRVPWYIYIYTEARNAYVVWRAACNPRDHHTRHTMNITRLHFKNALHKCKPMEDRCRSDVMADSLKQQDPVGLWKKVKQSKQSSVPLSSKLVSMWKKHYFDLLNYTNNLVIKRDVEDNLSMSNFDVAASLKSTK